MRASILPLWPTRSKCAFGARYNERLSFRKHSYHELDLIDALDRRFRNHFKLKSWRKRFSLEISVWKSYEKLVKVVVRPPGVEGWRKKNRLSDSWSVGDQNPKDQIAVLFLMQEADIPGNWIIFFSLRELRRDYVEISFFLHQFELLWAWISFCQFAMNFNNFLKFTIC